ncbi:MAG: DUF2089 domain-containing protein [Actinomycetia bacterium]|nr:DUF2089 domain-containing protein [Actinomycetes bacterium]
MTGAYRAPSDCPVCGERLAVIRLGCPGCGSEIGGHFQPCEFCALSEVELDVLRVFLAARGNVRELEKHLGVSYPTARARLTQVLSRLGLAGAEAEPEPVLTREQVLREVAAGALDPAEAQRLLVDL